MSANLYVNVKWRIICQWNYFWNYTCKRFSYLGLVTSASSTPTASYNVTLILDHRQWWIFILCSFKLDGIQYTVFKVTFPSSTECCVMIENYGTVNILITVCSVSNKSDSITLTILFHKPHVRRYDTIINTNMLEQIWYILWIGSWISDSTCSNNSIFHCAKWSSIIIATLIHYKTMIF